MRTLNKTSMFFLLGITSLGVNASEVEVNFNPLSILSGASTIDALIGVDRKIRLGPTAGFMNLNINTVNVRAFDLGVRGEYAYKGYDTHGMYSAAKLYYSNVSVSVQDDILVCQSNSATGAVISGYVWRWKSGFSAKIGAGIKQTILLNDAVACETSGSLLTIENTEPKSDLKLEIDAGISWSM